MLQARTTAFLLIALMSVLVAMAGTVSWQDSGRLDLADRLSFLEDPRGDLTLDDVRVSDDWRAHDSSTFNKGYSDSGWWLRFDLTNDELQSVQRLLSIAYPVLGDVQVHVLANGEVRDFHQLGHDYPFHQRPVDHRYFIVPLEWQAQESLDIYLRVKSDSSVQVPVKLWEPETFYSHDMTRNILHGIYFGALLVIAVYNLLLFFALGDRNYLYYVGLVLAMALLLASLTGYGYRHLWPAASQWNDQAILVFVCAVLLFGAQFSRRFLELRTLSPPLDYVLLFMMGIAALVLVAVPFMSYQALILTLIPLVVVGCIYAFGCGLYAWRQGQVTARYYVIAWSFLLAGGVILALSKGGVLPSNAFTDHAVQIGSLIEVVLLSFALAQRINVERKLRYEAQAETLATSRQLNRELEERVQARTRELETLNERLNELSMTDELTGLRNRRFLDSVLKQEVERARRSGRPLAVALLDIDHFKPVNDTHGHQVGDECLRLVGELIHSGLRWPSDVACRYGGEEFAIVFPDTDAEGALIVVERIRERISSTRIEVDDLSLQLTVSGGVHAQSIAADTESDRLLRCADEALYRAKAEGRDRACIYRDD